MPSLSRNNAAMHLPHLVDEVQMYGRVKLGVLFGDPTENCRLWLLNLFLYLSIKFKNYEITSMQKLILTNELLNHRNAEKLSKSYNKN